MSDPTAVSRKLVAVFAADVEGYSRLMGADEVGTLKGLTERRAMLDKLIADHGGRIANTAGDSVKSIVATIEPQLYAAENFRARRKPPGSLDAWDLVMRALSHYWRVTPQDNLAAQALLEKAIAMDPNYGQALGV